MNPIYKFELSVGSTTQQCYPIYGDGLAKEWELESGQQFFRARLSGKLTFESTDYARIVAAAFDTEFTLTIYISYNAGANWTEYWVGTFWKTDCEFDGDAQTVTVNPTVKDQYNDIIAGLEKEYNLIELAPEIIKAQAEKRAMVQIYVPGDTIIGCTLHGLWWEEECDAVGVNDTITVLIDGVETLVNKLTDYCKFTFAKAWFEFTIGGNIVPDATGIYSGNGPQYPDLDYTVQYTTGDYRLTIIHGSDSSGDYYDVTLQSLSNSNIYWGSRQYFYMPTELQPYGSASGIASVNFRNASMYMRVISDKQTANAISIPSNDLVHNERNYKYIIPYANANAIIVSQVISITPTEWGQYKTGQYYDIPYDTTPPLVPVARNSWGRYSVWFRWGIVASDMADFDMAFTMNHTYPINSVISVLLGQIAPDISHLATTAYSRFLYSSSNPITGLYQRLFITPKSNVTSVGYDQPAQKALVKLKDIFDMLRDCYRCYWFVDSSNRLRIEHISYFMNGGNYPGDGSPSVGINLTQETVSRNGKAWAFARNQYSFEKPEMTARYQFSWMDDLTQPFNGTPIDIISKYVNPDNIEDINISKFSSDIDYIMLNPSQISKDGFVLLSIGLVSNVPTVMKWTDTLGRVLQNGYASFDFLRRFYYYDLPARNYSVGGVAASALGMKKLKIQTIKFPAYTDPNLLKLITTSIGNGTIQKLSVTLSSRNATATLKYDTE